VSQLLIDFHKLKHEMQERLLTLYIFDVLPLT